MGLKIIASDKEEFEKIDNALKVFKNESFYLLDNFRYAELSIHSDTIILSTDTYNYEYLNLNIDRDKILSVSYHYLNEKYTVFIIIQRDDITFQLNLNNRNKSDLKVQLCTYSTSKLIGMQN